MNEQWNSLNREELYELLNNDAKNWLAMDGVWFQAVEKRFGMEAAMACNQEVWERYTAIEARRIKKFLNLPKHPGLDGLEQALQLRFYWSMNQNEIQRNGNTLKYIVKECRVQHARLSKGLEMHPCKRNGIPEYTFFAKEIDDRIKCECISCYPDITEADCSCSWLFTLNE